MSTTACLNHPLREAAARCTSCGNTFCRECITDLEGRMVCVSCYRQKTAVKDPVKRDWYVLTAGAQFVLGLGLVWFTTWFLGRMLLNLPAEVHEGSIWMRISGQ